MANWLAGIATAVAKAATTAASNKSGSSSSPSSSSSGGSSGGSSGSYTYKDSDGGNRTSNDNYDYAAAYNAAKAQNNIAGMQYALDQRSNKLGGTDAWDSWQRNAYQDLQIAQAGQQQYNQPAQMYQQQTDSYLQDYERQQAAIRAEQAAKVQQNIANLDAQKPLVQQAAAQANSMAQQNYMNVLNPNGANAEQLAALGLSSSGLSEDAAIKANNSYTQAVNSNQQSVQQQLNAIDLAKQQAQLTGDIATAQQLQSYYDSVLQQGMQAAGNIAQLQQWGVQSQQNQYAQDYQNKLNEAGLTGMWNGQQTMQGQQLSYTIAGMSLDNQLKQFELLLQKTYGMDQAAASLEAQRIANQGGTAANAGKLLENEYQKIYNQYARKTL